MRIKKETVKITAASGLCFRTPVGLRRLGVLPPDTALLLSPNTVAFVECVSSIETYFITSKNNRSNTQ